MINLEKIKQENCQPPSFFKKTCTCTILPFPFFNFSDSPLRVRVQTMKYVLEKTKNDLLFNPAHPPTTVTNVPHPFYALLRE